MWKFFVGLLVGIAVAVLGTLIIVLAVGKLFSSKQPTIAGDSALVLALAGDIPEAAPVELPIPFLQSDNSPTVRDLWTSLRQAATDNRIRGLVIQPQSVVAGWGKLQEIRHELVEFKKSGKPVYAFLQGAGSREYYLASVADKIYLSPDDSLDVKGFFWKRCTSRTRWTSWAFRFRLTIWASTRTSATHSPKPPCPRRAGKP